MGTYQITWKMTLLNQQIRNTFYYDTTVGEPSDSEWQDVVDEIRADLVTDLQSHMTNDWTFYAIDVRRVDIAGLLSRQFLPTSGDLVGSNAGDTLATQVAMLVSVRGTTTKPNRARTYLGGWAEGVLTSGLFPSNQRNDAESLIDNQSDLNAAGTNPLQRVAAQWNTAHTQVTATNFISASPSKASEVPATQRRRRIGVGI